MTVLSRRSHRAYVERRYGTQRDLLSRPVLLGTLGRLGRPARKKDSFVLHIPKTGGTALKNAIRPLTKDRMEALGIDSAPHVLGHRASRSAFRDANLQGSTFSFAFRDPLSRYVSAFYEMLRQGRPYKRQGAKLWSRGEFVAFLWFKEPNDLFEALGSTDDRMVSAAVTAFHEILALQWDHVWMLGTVEEFTSKLRNVRHFCPIEDLGQDLPRFLELRGDADIAAIRALMVAARPAPAAPAPLSDAAIANLRAFRPEEFRLYDFLVERHRRDA